MSKIIIHSSKNITHAWMINYFCQQANINPENDDENINEFSNLFLESYKQYDESSIQDDYIIGINIFFLKVIWNFYLFIFIYSFLFIHLLIKNI